MIRRKRPRSHSNHERWLVSYADFITLLFAFFVVLYASAQVDQRKVGRLAIAIQEAFQQLGVFPSSAVRVKGSSLPSEQELQIIEEMKRSVAPPPLQETSQDSSLADLERELQSALASEIAANAVALHRETEGLVISLREFGFFDSGSAEIKKSALPALDHIASILAVRSCRLRIEGHTDTVPIHTERMASNWELSTARSTELVRLLIVQYRISPERLSAAGYAQYHPIATNETSEGRAQNRRVDIVILSAHIMELQPDSKPSPAIRE